ncbi:MAG: phosphoglucomutase/phosphomannomutase family protein [bacterium]|jgi:phosphomannomutase
MVQIRFGTDGWRGIVDADFTDTNVARVAEAIVAYLYQQTEVNYKQGVVIGYDNRPSSNGFAKLVAVILTKNDIPVYLSRKTIPTPAVAYAIKEKCLAGGIMITASHNPPQYNGIKFIPHYAGPATEDITKVIEEILPVETCSFTAEVESLPDTVDIFDCGKLYLDCLRRLSVYNNHDKKLRIVVDPMYGSGSGYLEKLLWELNHEVIVIHGNEDGKFGSLLPEPKESNLHELSKAVLANKADLGIALDGDADRFGFIDSNGKYISPNQIYGLMADYIGSKAPQKATFARTVATTHMIDRVGESLGLNIIETPVGFKYIAQAMLKENAILGAEESGGLGINQAIPEKDGITAGLLLVQVLSRYNGGISEALEYMHNRYGRLVSKRVDILCSETEKSRVLVKLASEPPYQLAERRIKSVLKIDGLKVVLSDNAWCLIRPSGTENMIRLYAEAESQELLDQILAEAANYYQLKEKNDD